MEEMKLLSCPLEMRDLIPASTKTNLNMKNTRTEKGKRERKERSKFLAKKRKKEREKLRYVFVLLHFSRKNVLTSLGLTSKDQQI